MFNTDLCQEYRVLVDHFALRLMSWRRSALNGLRFSLLPEEEKLGLTGAFQSGLQLREALA
jgi:adenosine deaminase